jgi:hypothetical protein
VANVAQRSFSGGELSPSLYARTDVQKYITGARTLRNFVPQRHGGAANRAGTELVREVKDSSKVVRLIPWVFNDSQTYVLEFGERYLRVHQNGGVVVVTGVAAWVTATAYALGDIRSNGGVNYYATAAHTSGATTQPGVGANWSAVWYALTGSVYEIPTPYAAADVALLKYAQSADVMTLVHPSYAPRELSRTAHTRWVLAGITIGPMIGQVTGIGSSGGSAGVIKYWAVTAVDEATNEEGLPVIYSSTNRIASVPAPVILTWTPAANSVEYNVYASDDGVTYGFKGPAGGTKLPATSDNAWTTNTSTVTTTSTALTQAATQARNPLAAISASERPYDGVYFVRARLSISSVGGSPTLLTGAIRAYYSRDGEPRVDAGIIAQRIIYGGSAISLETFTGSFNVPDNGYAAIVIDLVPEVTGGTTTPGATSFSMTVDAATPPFDAISWVKSAIGYTDTGVAANMEQAPPSQPALFGAPGDYPGAVGIYQQRRFFAASLNEPERVWGSRTSIYSNFAISTPLQADDMVNWRFAGRQVNQVRHLVDLGLLVAFTSGSEQLIRGDENAAGVIRPGEINPHKLSANGAADGLAPLEVDKSAIYVQAQGSAVHDLSPVQSSSYDGTDLTVFSQHLFDGYTLLDWAYAKKPGGVVWIARSDGVLLSLTYLREHQIWGWARHDTDGLVENVCAVPEGREYRVYLVVNRTIGGVTKRYIERMASRTITPLTNQRDFLFSDSTLSYDGWAAATGTITLSGGVAWDNGELLIATASVGSFVVGDVGNGIHITDASGALVRLVIEGWTSPTLISVRPDRAVPATLQNIARTTWAKAFSTFSGLSHLEGKQVSVLADGFVVASPNNADYGDPLTVVGGVISLGRPYAVVRVGLPYTSDLETLDIDTPSGPSLKTKKTNVKRVGLFLEKTRGIFMGRAIPTGTDPLENLDAYPARETENPDLPPALITDDIHLPTKSAPDTNGRIAVRQVDPLPATILAAMPEGDL